MSPLVTVPISKYETRGTNYLHLQQGDFGARGLFFIAHAQLAGCGRGYWAWAGLDFAGDWRENITSCI